MTSSAQQSVSRTILSWVVALAVVVAPLAFARDAHADTPQEQARKHYEAGSELYTQGDYRGAIREFETAGRLAPSPVLDFNIALAHERLGELEKARSRYKAYLDAMPNAANRAAVEAKIATLESELAERGATSAAAASNGGSDSGTVSGDRGSGASVGDAGDADAGSAAMGTIVTGSSVRGPESGASTTTPGAIMYAPTGDPTLDRVAAIDLAQIRDQRAGQMLAPTSEGGAQGVEPGVAVDDGQGPAPKKAKPLHKQWWFWVVIGVSAVILINMASSDDNAVQAQPAAAPVLMRF